jgi:hypothetical protein
MIVPHAREAPVIESEWLAVFATVLKATRAHAGLTQLEAAEQSGGAATLSDPGPNQLLGRTFPTGAALRGAAERLGIPSFDEVGNLFNTMVRASRLCDGHGFHSMPAVVVQWRTAGSRCRPYANINTLSGRGAVSTRQLFLEAGVPARYLRGLR